VWTWRASDPGITVHAFVDGAYLTVDRSRLVPTLDFELLASFVRTDEDIIDVLDAYRDALRTG
jgi:hypothetical protein